MRQIDADALKQDLTRFYDNIVTAKQLIDEQPTVSGWVSVKDRLPDTPCGCLVFNIYGWALDRWDGNDWMMADENEITHWMPLPPRPEEEK